MHDEPMSPSVCVFLVMTKNFFVMTKNEGECGLVQDRRTVPLRTTQPSSRSGCWALVMLKTPRGKSQGEGSGVLTSK